VVKYELNIETLTCVLSKTSGQTVTHADYQIEQVQGGSVGDVRLITGTAETGGGDKLPYEFILKVQKKWDCPVDPDSWRREYDLYKSDFGKLFSDTLRWPECFHAEMNEEENATQIWMEYIDGVSGHDLTVEMFERAAYEIGRFQGRLYAEQPPVLQNISNLSKSDIKKGYYFLDRSKKRFYDFIRSDHCGIPEHLCKMIIDMDENADEHWNRVEQLPIVLSHRDFWMENILFSDGKVVLIDWDTTGWGDLGEDIITLIADTDDVENIMQYYKKCFPAYLKGFMEYADISHVPNLFKYERMVIAYGYRIIAEYMYAETPERKELKLMKLQKIYEMKDM
jgi:hypothetical protein